MDARGGLCLGIGMSAPLPRFLVASAMRNEGAFLLEWVAWYRMLGFDLLIATNDCTDHSPEMLDILQDAGWLTHLRHQPDADTPPQRAALDVLGRHAALLTADWVLCCDVDEFLVLHKTDTILEFVGTGPWDFLGLAFHWKIFGIGGWQKYRPGLVHEQFRRAGVSRLPQNRRFKSMFRRPDMFARLGVHAPMDFRGDWTAHENAWLNSDGAALPQFRDPANHPVQRSEAHQIAHDNAQMNHYVLRSQEHWNAKKGTPAAIDLGDRYTDRFYARHNRNGTKDTSASRLTPVFQPIYEAALDLPGMRRLHHLSCAQYIERLCLHAGGDARTDPRWIDAMAAAG